MLMGGFAVALRLLAGKMFLRLESAVGTWNLNQKYTSGSPEIDAVTKA